MKLARVVQPRVNPTNSESSPLNRESATVSDSQQPIRILRIREVMNRTGLSRSTIWRLQSARKFPLSVVLLGERRGWYESEIDEWVKTRPRSRET